MPEAVFTREYYRDLAKWTFDADNNFYGQQTPSPNRDDYDSFGYKKGSVTREGNLILDNYLISIYGIEYAREHPLQKL